MIALSQAVTLPEQQTYSQDFWAKAIASSGDIAPPARLPKTLLLRNHPGGDSANHPSF
jgi:hypothetical protein